MTRPSLLMMNLGVASTAQGQQVVQSVVPQFLRRGHTGAINVVDVQIFRGPAVLAGEVVTLQGLLPVASKVVVILGLADVFIQLRILCKGFADLLVPTLFQASGAMLLRSSGVGEISATVNALDRAANRLGSILLPKLSQVKHILLLPVGGLASWTALLRRTSGLVEHLAYKALALFEAASCLPMSSQGARLAPLKCGCSLWHLRSTVGTGQDPVFPPLHSASPILSVL